MIDDAIDDLRGQLVDQLNSDPRTCDLPDVPALADVLLPMLRDIAATELSMAADAAEYCVSNPEQMWAQGVQFVVEALRQRARVIDRQVRGGSE